MPEYQFADSSGSIILEDYDRSSALSGEDVLDVIKKAFAQFPHDVNIEQVKDLEDVYHVNFVNNDDEYKDIYFCAKGTTPGGREGLKNEQRIQLKAKYLNYVYDKSLNGFKGVFMGVYKKDGATVLCTWKVMQSNASSQEIPISKQIKINSIAKAIQEGFVQQDKGKGEFACAFTPAFLYFYLRNNSWLHDGKITELNDHIEIDQNEEENNSINFKTGYDSPFSRNRILFGAPGTGKSFTINSDRVELLGEGNEEDYERVTFHPDYSYANFVGTYKPVMVDDSEEIISLASEKEVLAILTDETKSAQEKYDLLYDRFKGDGLTRLPLLLGLYTDKSFKTRKADGSDAAGDNSVERNHGRALRPYVNLSKPSKGKKDISYEYVPGPFMRMYVKALKNSRTDNITPFLLIIEEINRANVAAVFGDIFQLLDRGDDFVSEYPIQATEDIKKYLVKELGGNPDDYNKIKIPDNMFIWATMNSADQGVFPMDTAFKRRWDFTYLGIDDNDEELRGKYVTIGSKQQQCIEWNELRKAINDFLAESKINEDKQLGPYFISKSIVVPKDGDTEIDSKKFCDAFKNKVLMYLFDDAAKQKRTSLFEGSAKGQTRYSKICEAFDEQGIGIFNSKIQNAVKVKDLAINGHEMDENGNPFTDSEE